MKRFSLFAFAVALSLQGIAAPPPETTTLARPKLVVGIVVDQMRWDYLYRLYDRFGSGGFQRLMNGGFQNQQAMISYLPSYTAPGHACIYTGSVPSLHGIAANDWIDNTTGKKTYCVDDATVEEVNNGKQGGKSMSPRNLLATTITDELRLATNFKSRIFGVAIKDRGSILPAGHLANGAFWLDDSEGNFCSSTYYDTPFPNWLKTFNARRVADSLMKKKWELTYNAATYTQSTADNNKYEGAFKGESAPVFPHDISTLNGKEQLNALKATPAGNTLTLLMARALRDGEQLGKGASTDFLCVSLSSTDYAGHQFGPNAMELEDMYIKLDKELASFLQYLDGSVGAGNYTLFLTADHGAAHNPQFLIDHKVPAGFLSKSIADSLSAHLKDAFNQDSLIKKVMNYQVYLNYPLLRAKGISKKKVKESIVEWLNERPELAYVIDMEHMNKVPMPSQIQEMVANGYHRGRSGAIEMIPQAGWFEGYGKTGTTHGTWNPYDTHIPLLWFGWGIPKGSSNTVVHMTDISATLAALLHIQMPNACIGKPIVEIVK